MKIKKGIVISIPFSILGKQDFISSEACYFLFILKFFILSTFKFDEL